MPAGYATCHAKVLRLIEHRIQTGFGISKDSISWSLIQNLGGLGQGNGAGPPSWHSHCLVLTVAYELMTDERVNFNNPTSEKKFVQWLVGYVDDNTLLTQLQGDDFQPNAAPELMAKAQKCLEVWQCLIHITGGELELEKSCIAMITWKEAKGKELLCTMEDTPGTVSM